jgi:hypothetical protein
MIMKRYLLLPVMALLLTSCLSPYGEAAGIANVPGVEPGKGNNYDDRTTYKGALLPDPSYGEDRQGMIDLLMLVGEQRGDIDDALFVQRLDEKIFNCTKRFMYITEANSSTPDWWTDAMMWDGGEMHYDIALYDDGTLAVRHVLGCCGDFDMIDYIVENYGYHGWSESVSWEYDPETNTLYTSDDRSYAAQVLYFDGEIAVLEGHVYPMWIYQGQDYRRSSPMELYAFKFTDGKDSYLEGYDISFEEYNALCEEWYGEYMMFEGKHLPGNGALARDYMRKTIALMESQQAEDIDDEGFETMLSTMRLSAEDRFATRTESEFWTWGRYTPSELFDKVSVLGDMASTGDGHYVYRTTLHDENVNFSTLAAMGYKGWYGEGAWSYDAATNTLTMVVDGVEHRAVVRYFDAATKEVVLRGTMGFLFDISADDEIVRCKFYNDVTEHYLDEYLPYGDFVELWQTL